MPAGAVFLSYASEDAAAAERIAAAPRSSGIEVWFDRSELRGGVAGSLPRGAAHVCVAHHDQPLQPATPEDPWHEPTATNPCRLSIGSNSEDTV